MNEKGFAATGILYTILVLFILIMFSMLTLLNSRNNILNKIQDEVEENITELAKYSVYENGTVVYFNPETATICSPANAVSTTGTKTGCMKWYVFNDSILNGNVTMILDHNTTATVAFSDAQSELNKLVSESNWQITPRLITAAEVAMISGHSAFDVRSAHGGSWFYFGTNSTSDTSLRSNYSWLYDYTYNCTSNGCNTADSSTHGYWTTNLLATDTNYAWFVSESGSLHNYRLVTRGDLNGVRPVITVNKAFISSNPNNLITNGDLALKNNTNFSNFTYNEAVDGKYLSYSDDSKVILSSDELILVDPNKEYKFSMDLKRGSITSNYLIGLMEYDVDKKTIDGGTISYIPGSLTTLSRDLKNGDTVVYFDDLSGFNISASTPYYQLGFIFWNYQDSTGYTYPEETYSRNYFYNLYKYGNVDFENNLIILDTAWSGNTIPAGTKVSQSSSKNAYNYSIALGSLSSSWDTYSATITGVGYGTADYNDKFRPGTKYVKPFVWFNNNNTAGAALYLKNISLIEVE